MRFRTFSRDLRKLFTSVSEKSSNPFFRAWTLYNDSLVRRPLLTKSITSGILSLGADVLCQISFPNPISKVSSENDKPRFDILRAAKFTFLGTFFTAPALHYWYGFLMKRFPGMQLKEALKRLFLDQTFFAPSFLSSFFSAALLLDGYPEKILPKIKADLIQTMLANYSVWVPCQFINFRLVPPHLQVLFANFVGFFWNIYLSYSTFKVIAPAASDSTRYKEG